MLPLLVQRELRVALLRRGAREQWMQAVWATAVVTLVSLFSIGLTGGRSSGRALFFWLFALAIIGVVRRGFGLTADLFSEERRNGTLGLVVLTGLSPLEIFLHKLLGAVLLVAYGLFGGLPFFAIPFLAGGVNASQFVCAFVFLANALLFCVAIGLLASVVHRDGGQAQITAQALAAVLCLTTPCLFWLGAIAGRTGGLSAKWLALSPAHPAFLVFASFRGASMRPFWVASAFTLGYSIASLLLAAIILNRTWRDSDGAFAETRWRVRLRAWLRRGGAQQQALRQRLLENHPFCWLTARDRTPVIVAYGILATAASIWLVGWAAIGARWLTVPNAFLSSIILHQVLNVAVAYGAGRRFAEERLSGGFEVLLTSPLDAGEMVDGQNRALLVQFRTVGLLALLLDTVFCWTGLASVDLYRTGAAGYLFAWMMIMGTHFAMHLETAARAMWISAWTGRPGYAAMQAGGRVWWIFVWAWFFVQLIHRAVFGRGGLGFFVAAFLFVPMLAAMNSRGILRRKLTEELRQIACAPIPSRRDKRFKHWSPDKIYPPGRWGDLVLRPATPRRPGRMDALNG